MNTPPRSVMIIAGEPSADIHGAALARALKERLPDIALCGIGSTRMAHAGVDVFYDLARYAVIGFIEVMKHLRYFREAFALACAEIERRSPEAVILIDFPGFNLRLAKTVKQRFPHVKVIYFISPQIWAWGGKRIELIRAVVDKMVVIFKFEETLYRSQGISADFVGHPLLDHVSITRDRASVRRKLGIPPEAPLIALLPGSRKAEIERLLPVFLRAASAIQKQHLDTRFILIRSENIPAEMITDLLERHHAGGIMPLPSHDHNALA